MGKVYTLGYAAAGSDADLVRLMADPRMLLVDVRDLPVSRWRPEWRKCALADRWGRRYIHMRGLGNVNRKEPEKGFLLRAPDRCLYQLRLLLDSGYSVVLVCACGDYNRCHRRLVFDLLTREVEHA